jgi:hypothetical protein
MCHLMLVKFPSIKFLTDILQLQTQQFSKKVPFILESVLNHLPTSIKNTSHDILVNQFRTIDVSSVTYVTEQTNK